MRNIKLSLILFLLLSFKTVTGQIEGDRVIAVVGNEIITESDFQYQVQLYARQNQLSEINPVLIQQIFQSMLSNKIILAKAEQDSVIVTEDEVLKELDSRVKGLIAQVGSVERLEEVYGMNLPKIKNLIKDDLQKNIKIDRMRRRKFQGGIKISESEVREFYETYKDSLPDQSNEYEVAHIIMERKVSEPERTAAKNIALQILDSIKNGEDFSELAKRNSGDSLSAIQGGDLGYAGKGTFVKEFEDVVFNLNEGEVSDIVETQFGYHIIKLNEKSGDRVKSQHILIKYPKFESSDFETITFLKDLKNSILRGDITFDSAAKLYSEDLSTNEKGGYIGKIPAEQFDSLTIEEFSNLSPGDITDPLRVGDDIKYGYEIYKFIAFYPEHKLNYKDDYETIKKFALSYKENTEMEEWIEEMRKTVYVDIRM